jgi:hypothetical protein
MLLAAIDELHKGTYDFFYLPIDFKVLDFILICAAVFHGYILIASNYFLIYLMLCLCRTNAMLDMRSLT